MKSSRDGYRGRYHDRHNFSTRRNDHSNLSTRGDSRGHSSRSNDHNSSTTSLNESYNYRSSRISINSRPVSSRNGPPKHQRYQRDDDYPSSSSNRTNNFQSNYYDNHSPPSRYDRSSSFNEQPFASSSSSRPPTSLYYSSSSQSISPVRDRGLPSQHLDAERSRYGPSNYRRNSASPPPVPSYRNERTMDYGTRNTNSDVYMRTECRSVMSPPVTSRSVRGDSYGENYRSNDYPSRSDRYEIPLNRTNSSSSYHRNDLYRSSSNISMPSPPSSYITRDHYVQDPNYRPRSQSRDYGPTSSYSNYSSPMDHDEGFYRNNRDNNYNDNRSSHRDRPNLKRSNSRYNDDGPTSSKRPMRR